MDAMKEAAKFLSDNHCVWDQASLRKIIEWQHNRLKHVDALVEAATAACVDILPDHQIHNMLRDALAPFEELMIAETHCHWIQGCEGGVFDTDCGHCFEVTEGTPKENGFVFCCFCGKPLGENLWEQEDLEDDNG